MRKVRWVIAAVAAVASSCSKSNDDVVCQPGYALCAGACLRVGADAQNCGACGRSCGQAEVCVAGACVADCRASLHAPIDDPWGYAWDGLERPAAGYLDARAACEALGGRLPTASEIVRAGPKSGTVGDTYQTSPIWSLAPVDGASAISVRMSDGTSATSPYAPAAPPHYRCVCPPARAATFAGSACYTTGLGIACAPLAGDPRFNLDADDRAPLPRSAAMYECALSGGALATPAQLVAAFLGGLPNPSNAQLHSADAISGAGLDVAVVSSAAPTFGEAQDVDFRAFRCVGPAVTGVAATVANGFHEPRGGRVMDDPDHSATTYAGALFDCVGRGGHLPTGSELAAFAIQGLPAGAVTGARWTADPTGATTVESFAWRGTAYWPVDPDLAPTAPTTNGVAYDATTALRSATTAVLPYRCIYYPVVPGHPTPAACASGDCLAFSVGTRARVWFERTTHGGLSADTYSRAAEYCASRGGRLPSVRDFVEAVRAGLTNPNENTYVTSDFVTATRVRTFWWTTAEVADPAPAAVEAAEPGKKYLCMWTDELR